eukprot:scaffold155915_cov14-Tisochrysis_lutea.AAC.1
MGQLSDIGEEDVFEELDLLEHTDLSNVEYMVGLEMMRAGEPGSSIFCSEAPFMGRWCGMHRELR